MKETALAQTGHEPEKDSFIELLETGARALVEENGELVRELATLVDV